MNCMADDIAEGIDSPNDADDCSDDHTLVMSHETDTPKDDDDDGTLACRRLVSDHSFVLRMRS